MRRPVTHFAALCASVALALPPMALPVQAQDRLNRKQAIQLCVQKTGTQDRQTVGTCVVEEFEARGQRRAAAQAREELGLPAQAPAPQAPARLTRDDAIRICVDRLNSQDRQVVGACVADEFEANGQAGQAANIRGILAAEAQEARQAQERAAAEARAAEQARQAQERADAEARAAAEARQAQERAEAEQRAAQEAREAEERAAAAAARRAQEAAAEAARLTRDQAIQICVDRLGSRDRQVVGACVADEFDAVGQDSQADRIRAILAEEAAAAEAATQAQADAAEADQQERAPALTRAAARDACRAELGRERRAEMRGCVADRLEADGQVDLADRVRASAPDSRIADEVAARGEPELTAEEQAAAQRAGDALDSDNAAAAAANTESARGEVVEETVRSADVRSSADDFETGAVVSDDDDRGLSRGQKLALGALGALAVGTLLNNRNRVVSNSGDRVIVQRDDGDLQVLKDDDALLRQPGATVRTENFNDGSTRTIVTREDGSQVVTIRDASLRVLRRTLIEPNGASYVLIDDTTTVAPVDVTQLPSQPILSAPVGSALDPLAGLGAAPSADPLRDALRREAGLTSPAVDRRFSLSQVRTIPEVRALAPAFEVADVTFASGSAAIAPEQARNLTDLARLVLDAIRTNPREVFLIEGHTDAVGDAAYNLALSDRRAESLALALNEYFAVPVENMVVQGYGEQFLKIPVLTNERANRRAAVRQITGLLRTAAAN